MKRRATAGFTLVEIMIVVVIIGLLAAMAIPAFQKVRSTTQDKAVLANLRQLAGAANTYFTQTGMTSVNITDLVGSNSTQLVDTFTPVAGETYTPTLLQGAAITASPIAGARTSTYGL
jgi:type IV pilus assembly protein PilA